MKISALKLAIAAATFASFGALAATQGSLNSTSTGTVQVNVTKGTVVQITGLTDINLGNFTDLSLQAAGGATGGSSACVYSSVPNYHAQLTSTNANIAFAAAIPAVTEVLAANAVAPGGLGFTSPGDPVAQLADDVNADGTCDPLAGDLNCIVYPAGMAPISYVAPAAAVPQVNANYRMGDGGGNFVDYTATFTGGGAGTLTADGSALGPFTGSATANCGGGTNASVDVSIAGTAFSAVPDGAYSDTLTILITPN